MPPFKDWRLTNSHNDQFDELSQWLPEKHDCQTFETYQQHLEEATFMKKKFYVFTLLVALPLSFTVACVERQPNNTPTPPNTATNSSTPMNENSSTSTNEIRINCGGTSYTSAQGVVWSTDFGYNTNSDSYAATQNISDTQDPELYQTERYGKEVRYSLPIANGQYTLRLHFAEIYVTQAGERFFNVEVEGETVFRNFDIAREAGAANRALARTLPVNVTDGTMDIRLSNHQPTVPQGAKINAIEIIRG